MFDYIEYAALRLLELNHVMFDYIEYAALR